MNYSRIIIASLTIAVAGILVPLCSMNFFSWVFKLPPTDIWKWTPMIPLSSFPVGWWVVLLVGNVFLSFSVVFLFALFYKSIPGTGVRKGLAMGLLLYPLGILFPAFNLYELTNLNTTVIWYLMLEGFGEFLLYGAIAGFIYRE